MVTIDLTDYCGASRCRDTEILACRIAQHANEKIILDLKHEGWDIVENGIECVVKNIADTLDIPYEQIEFCSSDREGKSEIFVHRLNTYYDFYFAIMVKRDNVITLPTDFKYGLFLGRPSDERLYSFYRHMTWDYKHLGLASQHIDIMKEQEWNSDYMKFIAEHSDKWQYIKSLLPYSDIEVYYEQAKMCGVHGPWEEVYKNISAEIVCETVQTEGVFYTSEKIYRPIAYGKLFMCIASPGFEQRLEQMGFDIFSDIIDKTYDKESGYIRIDSVFASLRKLLENPPNMTELLPRLQYNQKLFKKIRDEISERLL